MSPYEFYDAIASAQQYKTVDEPRVLNGVPKPNVLAIFSTEDEQSRKPVSEASIHNRQESVPKFDHGSTFNHCQPEQVDVQETPCKDKEVVAESACLQASANTARRLRQQRLTATKSAKDLHKVTQQTMSV